MSRNKASIKSDSNLPSDHLMPTVGITGQLPVTSRIAVDAGLLWTTGRFSDGKGGSAPYLQRVFVGASLSLFQFR